MAYKALSQHFAERPEKTMKSLSGNSWYPVKIQIGHIQSTSQNSYVFSADNNGTDSELI